LKPRVLQLIDSFDQGGSELQALQLTRLLQGSGNYDLYLASLKPNGVLRREIEGLKLGEIPSFPLRSFYDRNAIVQLRRLAGHLRTSRIELLHTHDFYTNVFGMTAGFLARVPVRIASRRDTSGMRSDTQERAQRVAYSLAHRIVANSEAVRQKLIAERLSERKIAVIHNGLDLERFVKGHSITREDAIEALGVKAFGDRRFVTIVANMRHEVKDYPTFLRAARRVQRATPEVMFLLAGEGELLSSLKSLAAELGVGEHTFFLGRCEKLVELLSISEVCVLSSRSEGFSNAILEYMAASRPVVATDVGGAKEAIIESETGYLVPSGDDQLMADRIVSLLREPERARHMGERGRRIVERKFSCEAQLRNTEMLYGELLASRGKVLPRLHSTSREGV
jgi:glycosyltransferase involved in cell wall biosynthesis